MAKSQKARQKKLAVKKAKRKIKKTQPVWEGNEALSTLKKCARGSIHECYVSDNIITTGLGSIVLSRNCQGNPGILGYAVVLIDRYCLGVKDCFFHYGSMSKFRDSFEQMASREALRPANPEKAVKIIKGAIAYARSIGFGPHKDFKHFPLLLADVDASLCEEEMEFGHEGKPLFIQGPNDSAARISLIVRTLREKLGEDGFNFTLGRGMARKTLGSG